MSFIANLFTPFSEGTQYYNAEIPPDYILKQNDLIVTMTDLSKGGDTLGYSALVPALNGKVFLHNQRIGKIVLKNNLPLTYFLYWLMRQPEYRHFILGSATGSTVRHTSPTRICAFEFLLPSVSELIEFKGIVEELVKKEQINLAQNEKLEAIRDLLLPRLMSGKMDVD